MNVTEKPSKDQVRIVFASSWQNFRDDCPTLNPVRDHSWWSEVHGRAVDTQLVYWASSCPEVLTDVAVEQAAAAIEPEASMYYLYVAWIALRHKRSLKQQRELLNRFEDKGVKGLQQYGGVTLLRAYEALIEAEAPAPRASQLEKLATAVEKVATEHLKVTAWRRSARMVNLALLERGDLTPERAQALRDSIERAFKEERDHPEDGEPPQLLAESLVREARYLSLPNVGKYPEALDRLNKAIAADRPRDADDEALYAVRVAGYEQMAAIIRVSLGNARMVNDKIDELTRLQSSGLEELKQAQEEALTELRHDHGELRKDTLQLLGLLAAVIAFIVTSVEFATKYPASEAGALLLLAAGAILLVFSGFSLIFGGSVKSRAIVLVVVIGIGLIALATVLGDFEWVYQGNQSPE